MANYRKSFNFRNGVQVDDDNFIVNANGLVGIGTSVPTEFLDVRGTAKVVGVATIKTVWTENSYVAGVSTVISTLRVGIASISNGIVTATSVSGIITYYGDGGKLLNLPTSQWVDVDPGFGYTSIYAAGNVGIATTYPNFALQIGGNPNNSQQGVGINSTGNIRATGILTTRQLQFVGDNAGITGVTSIIASTTEALLRVTQLGSGLAFLVEDSGSPDSSSFVIDGSGRGFIGTTGDASAVDGITFFNSYARFISTITGNTATDGMLIGEGPANNGYQNILSYDRPIKVETNGTLNHITLVPSASANVGVATTNPTSKLTVAGNVLVSGITTVTELKASVSTTGISTVTEYFHVGTSGTIFTVTNDVKLGIGTNNPTSEIQVIKSTPTLVEVISTGQDSRISIGQSVGVGRSSAYLRFGSPSKNFDIVNNDTGNVNFVLHGGLPGVGTGAWRWLYGQTNSELMTFTYDGRLGIAKTDPEHRLHVVGTSTVTNSAFFGSNVSVVGIISASTAVVSTLTINSPTLDNINLNVNVGLSTFNNISASNVSVANSIGIGTATPIADIDARSKTLLVGAIGVNTAPQFYNTPASGSLVVGGQVNVGSIGIGTTSFAYLTSGEYVAVYGPLGMINSDIRLYRGNILGDDNSSIGIGTTTVNCAVDFASAGHGLGFGAAQFKGSFLRLPHATRTQRVGFLTSSGALFYNSTDARHEAYINNQWVNIGIQTSDINTNQITSTGIATVTQLTLTAGTNTAAPLRLASGTNLTTPVTGAIEYDGTHIYATPDTTSGRGHLTTKRTFRLTSNGSAIGPTIADFYGSTSAINLAASSVYKIRFHAYFTKTTAGTATWTLTASSAPTLISGYYTANPVTGVAAGTPITGYTGSQAATTAAFNATASLTTAVNHSYMFEVEVVTNLATTFKLQLTLGAGTATPLAGSYYTVERISTSTGSFA